MDNTLQSIRQSFDPTSEHAHKRAASDTFDALYASNISNESSYLQKLNSINASFFTKKSKQYDNILSYLSGIDQIMDVTLTPKMDRTVVSSTLLDSYAGLLQECNLYIENNSRGITTKTTKQRLVVVREIQEKMKDEAIMIRDIFQNFDAFSRNTTLRELMAGIRPKEFLANASMFSIPEADIEIDPDMTEGQKNSIHDLQEARHAVRDSELIDADQRAILNILIEQIHRSRGHNTGNMAASLADRVIAVATEAKTKENEALLDALIATVSAYKSNMNLSTEDETIDRHITGATDTPNSVFTGDDSLNPQMFAEYKHLTPETARYLAKNNAYNQEKYANRIYGKTLSWEDTKFGGKYGYIQTDQSFYINSYLRNSQNPENMTNDDFSVGKNFRKLATIHYMDEAANATQLPQKTRLHRMVTAPYMHYNLGISLKEDRSIPAGTAAKVNAQAGKIITDSNFMCTGYVVDSMFSTYPIMLTMLCDEGTKVFSTYNLAEGEITFGRNTSYMVLGAVAHGANNRLNIPISHSHPESQYIEGEEMTGNYAGLEIFVKVLPQGDMNTNKSSSAEDFRDFQQHQNSYEGYFGQHDMEHRNAYLKMAQQDYNSLTPDEKVAMDEYTNDSAAINTRLRSGQNKGNITDTQGSHIKQAFAKHPIPVDMTTYRGVTDGFLSWLIASNPSFDDTFRQNALINSNQINHEWLAGHLNELQGVAYQDNAFLSTTTNEFFADRWSNMLVNNENLKKEKNDPNATYDFGDMNQFNAVSGAHTMVMHLPAGTRAMFTDTMWTRHGRPRGQNEVTLDSGYHYIITGMRLKAPGRYEFEVSVSG